MQPQEIEVLEKHTQALNDHAKALSIVHKPITPLDKTPWSSSECAAYLRVETKTFLQSYAPLPSFPRPIKPLTATGKGNPKWNAQKVIDWFFAHEEETERRRRPRKNV